MRTEKEEPQSHMESPQLKTMKSALCNQKGRWQSVVGSSVFAVVYDMRTCRSVQTKLTVKQQPNRSEVQFTETEKMPNQHDNQSSLLMLQGRDAQYTNTTNFILSATGQY